MLVVPLYVQVTMSVSPATAGLYLVPAVIGNALGGLLTGYWIRRSGKYKAPTLVAAIISSFGHAALSILWTGPIGLLKSFFIFPGGLGTGISHSSIFVAIAAGTTVEEQAIATGGMYLCGSIGTLLGFTLGASVMRTVTEETAKRGLSSMPDGGQTIISKALADIGYIETLAEPIRDVIVRSYVLGFRTDFGSPPPSCDLSVTDTSQSLL